MDYAIEIKNLHVKISGFELKNINLNIPRGAVVGLIGRNGAGKTTLLKTLTDIYAPSEGTILYGDKEMRSAAKEVKERLGIVYDSLFYPSAVRACKIAKIIAPLYDDFDMDKWNAFMKRFGLDTKKAPAQYSKGMQMKFMLAMVLARNPDILILDEPTAGMDPAARAELMELIQEFMENEEKTVIFSTHITSDLDKIADYIALIANGRLVFMEEKDALLEHYALVQVEKKNMTPEIAEKLIGVKENSFGYVGLTREREKFEQMPQVKIARAAIEDLLIYGEGNEA